VSFTSTASSVEQNFREADIVALLVAHSNEDRLHIPFTELKSLIPAFVVMQLFSLFSGIIQTH